MLRGTVTSLRGICDVHTKVDVSLNLLKAVDATVH
jgi:hypothetical protein